MTALLAPPQFAIALPDGAHLGETSLDLPASIAEDQLVAFGKGLSALENTTPWWIADFIAHLQDRLASGADRQTCKDTLTNSCKFWPEYSRGRLMNMASVARRVPRRLRKPGLSFNHHEYVATLADEDNAEVLQAHYLKVAVKTECTAEELRLMIADTRKGRQHDKPSRLTASREQQPIEHEPEVLSGTHAQLTSEASRSLTRLRDWYNTAARKAQPSSWPADRKQALLHDLEPVMVLMTQLASVCEELTS